MIITLFMWRPRNSPMQGAIMSKFGRYVSSVQVNVSAKFRLVAIALSWTLVPNEPKTLGLNMHPQRKRGPVRSGDAVAHGKVHAKKWTRSVHASHRDTRVDGLYVLFPTEMNWAKNWNIQISALTTAIGNCYMKLRWPAKTNHICPNRLATFFTLTNTGAQVLFCELTPPSRDWLGRNLANIFPVPMDMFVLNFIAINWSWPSGRRGFVAPPIYTLKRDNGESPNLARCL